MQKYKINPIYAEHFKSVFKIPTIIALVSIIVLFIVHSIISKKIYAKNNGEKIKAVVYNIDKKSNTSNKNENSILNVYIRYKYHSQEYTDNLKEYDKSIKIGDTVDIYILNNNPKDFVQYQDSDLLLLGILVILFAIGFICSVIEIIKEYSLLRLYNNAESLDTIEAKFISVEDKTFIIPNIHQYCIVCRSDELNMTFYSHPYSQNPNSYIDKKGLTKFIIKYDHLNSKKYIMDVNTVDKHMLK